MNEERRRGVKGCGQESTLKSLLRRRGVKGGAVRNLLSSHFSSGLFHLPVSHLALDTHLIHTLYCRSRGQWAPNAVRAS